jgi:hypothetical protein
MPCSMRIGTQRVCVLQQRLARTLQSSGSIRVLDLPVALPPLVDSLWWHPSRTADPGHRWLQQLFRDAATSLGELGAVQERGDGGAPLTAGARAGSAERSSAPWSSGSGS